MITDLLKQRENGLRIDQLSSDYLNVTSNVYTWAEKYEAPAILKRDGVYFMFASKLTGWSALPLFCVAVRIYTIKLTSSDANDNIYSTATSLSGPWSSWQTCEKPPLASLLNFKLTIASSYAVAPAGTNTYTSQTTFILPVSDTFAM
jgi:hypothetical protein